MQFEGYDPNTNPLNTNDWAFPVCEVVHIIGFALLIGTITIVDLRLLGLGMKKQTAAELVQDTAPWTLLGLVLVLISGPLIFSSDPNLYIRNYSFLYKVSMLMVGILFNWTIHRWAAMKPNPGTMGAIVGGLSMLLWTSLIFAGIFIAFI